MMDSRDATNVLLRAVANKIYTEFNVAAVPGISAVPTVIKVRPKSITPFPFIYITADTSSESDVTSQGSSRDYNLSIRLAIMTDHNTTAEVTRDAASDEIIRILDTATSDYISLDSVGFNVYIQTIGDAVRGVNDNIRGGTYYTVDTQLFVRADFVGTPSTNQPVEAPDFTYTNFILQPTANAIEEGDSGIITTSLTYPSNNFGWNYVNGAVIQPFGSDGALVGNAYTIGVADVNIQLGVTLNYTFIDDSDITTQLQSTHQWLRQRSLRFGSISAIGGTRPTLTNNAATNTGVNLLTNWTSANKTVQIGTLAPVGNQIVVQGQNTEYIYIIFDANEDDLGSIEQDLFNTDITDRFEAVQTVGNYKVYLSTDPLNYTGDITLDLR